MSEERRVHTILPKREASRLWLEWFSTSGLCLGDLFLCLSIWWVAKFYLQSNHQSPSWRLIPYTGSPYGGIQEVHWNVDWAFSSDSTSVFWISVLIHPLRRTEGKEHIFVWCIGLATVSDPQGRRTSADLHA